LGKKSIRRHENGLKKAGVVEVRHITRSEDIEPYLDGFFAQHIARRAQTEAASHFLDVRYQQFYRLLTCRLALRGWLLFTVISLNNEPVAFHFGFIYGTRLLWYKPAFSIAYAQLSPGEVLLAALFRYCRDHGLRELDFTIGDDAFKSRFANVTRQNQRVEVFRSPPLQCLGYTERIFKEQAKRLGLPQRLRGEWHKLRTRFAVGQV
jgi:CelD/BcsL family acetyltransferase involved in cellulose biosynthesis